MKKHTVIAITSAITIAAGTLWVVGMPSSAPEQQETSEKIAATWNGESAGISYEEAIAELYARSTSISDQEILDIASNMKPDGSAAVDTLGAEEADRIMETLSSYEQEKASYILDSTSVDPDEVLSFEWDKQDAYTKMNMSPEQTLMSLIPGYTVTSCEEENGQVLVDVDEWMTQGYTEGSSDVLNVSAYRYYYTAVLEKGKDGNWKVLNVTNTERNFTWLEDAEVQQLLQEYAEENGKQNNGGKQDAGADSANGKQNGDEVAPLSEADKEGSDLQGSADGNGMKTASLKTYGDGKYSYNADKAIAYADKWATSRNPEYTQYPGVDCCNFVSQCLYAGGMPKNSSWYPASYAWINCSGAISNFKNYGTFMSANDGNVLRGNPVYYDWNSNGVYDHTAICVGKNNSGTPIIDAHTGDHYHATWSLGSNGTRATIQLRGNGSVGGSSTTIAEGGKWSKKDGSWYYYSADGDMLTGWISYKGQYYYLRSNGTMVTGWGSIGGSWYYFDKAGKMKTGWIKLSGKWYFLTDQGRMKTGWVQSKGKWYYMCGDGYAVTGWREIDGETYYMDEHCVMQTGLTEIDGMYYYFDSEGRKSLGWKTVGGDKYFFSPSAGGRAATGYWEINGRTYYFDEDGVLDD